VRRIKKFDSEENLQVMVADYLRLQYPNILFHSDFGSGIKLTIGQAAKQKRQNGGRRAWPDMFIARHKMLPVANEYAPNGYDVRCFGGLFLELKKDGTKLKREKDCKNILKGDTKLRKAGDWWDQHIEEQAEKLEQLRDEGYRAEFAVGFEEAKKIIDGYLS
jgi:hypothetical protein